MVRCIQFHFFLSLKGKGVVDIEIEIEDENFNDGDPDYESHEGMIDSLGSASTKDITTVDEPLILPSYHLFYLPKRMHWHMTIHFGDISLPKLQVPTQMRPTIVSETIPKVLNIVQSHPGNVIPRDHRIKSIRSSAVVSN